MPNADDTKVLLKELRALERSCAAKPGGCAPALVGADAQILALGLRSAAIPAVELALRICNNCPRGSAAALNTAWPQAPLVTLPLLADAAVQAAFRASGSGSSALLRLVGSHGADGAAEIAAAVGRALCCTPAADMPAVWGAARTFVATLLVHGPTHEIRRDDSDAYTRVELHETCIEALASHPPCFRELAKLTCCYSATVTGPQWLPTALRQLVRVQCSDLTALYLKAELCLMSAFEFAQQGQSALASLRLLASVGSFTADNARAESSERQIARLVFCAGHLLGVVPTVAERQSTLRWLRGMVCQAKLEPPMRAYVMAVALREQRVSDSAPTVTEAEAVLQVLAAAPKVAWTAAPADKDHSTMVSSLSQGCLSTVACLARPLAIGRTFITAFSSVGQVGWKQWMVKGAHGACSVADQPSRVTAAACTAALLLHPSASVRQTIAVQLQTQSMANEVHGGETHQLAMSYLPVVLHAVATEADGPTLATLLHLVPVLAQRRAPALAALRFIQQLLGSGQMLDVCVVLVAKLWHARAGASGSDDVLAILRSTLFSALESNNLRHHVAVASALEIVCRNSPSTGVRLVSLCVELVRKGRCVGAQAVALRCLSLLCDARELACLPVIRLLRKALPSGLDLQHINDDRLGPPLVDILVGALHDYKAAKAREQAAGSKNNDTDQKAQEEVPESATVAKSDPNHDAIAIMDNTVNILWHCISSTDDSRTPDTRAAAFNAFAELVDAGVESALEVVDAAPSRDQAKCLLMAECHAIRQQGQQRFPSASTDSLAACESLVLSVLSHQRQSCSRAPQALTGPQAPNRRVDDGGDLKNKLRGRIAWYSNTSFGIAPTGLLWCYRPTPPKDKLPRGQPVPRRHLVARAQGYREMLNRLLTEIDTSCDSWPARQQLPGGWAVYMERQYLSFVQGATAQASIGGEEVTPAEAARRAVDELSATLLAAANSGIPHLAQNAALGIGGLIAADGGMSTLELVDILVTWAVDSESSEWRRVGASLALGYATRAIRVGHPVLAKRVATALSGLLGSHGDETLMIQSAAAFALGVLTTTDMGSLDVTTVPPPCEINLLQAVVTALFLACVPTAEGMHADFVDMRSDSCARGIESGQVSLVAKPHRGHSTALAALGYTCEEVLRTGSNGRRLLIWFRSWAWGLVRKLQSDGTAVTGSLYLLASSTVACFNARLMDGRGVTAVLHLMNGLRVHDAETQGAVYIAQAALVRGVAVGTVDGHTVVDINGTMDTLFKTLESESAAEPMARAAITIALAQFFGQMDSPVPPRSAGTGTMLGSTVVATWDLYTRIADRLHTVLLQDGDSRVRAMAGVAIGMSTLVDVHKADARAVDESSMLGLPKGLELGTSLVGTLAGSSRVMQDLTGQLQRQAVLRVLAKSVALPRFSWGIALQSLIRGNDPMLRASAVKTMLMRLITMPSAESADSVAKQMLSELLEPFRFEAMFTGADIADAVFAGNHVTSADMVDHEWTLGCTLLQWLPLLVRLFQPSRATQLVSMVAAHAKTNCVSVAIRAVDALTAVLCSADIDGGHDDDFTAEGASAVPNWNLPEAVAIATQEAATSLCVSLPTVWQRLSTRSRQQHSLAYVDAVARLAYSLPAQECQNALESFVDTKATTDAQLAAGLRFYLQYSNDSVTIDKPSVEAVVRWCACVHGGTTAETTIAAELHRRCCSAQSMLGATAAEHQQSVLILLDELIVLAGATDSGAFGVEVLTMLGHAVRTALSSLKSPGCQAELVDDNSAAASADAGIIAGDFAELVCSEAWAHARQPILQRLLSLLPDQTASGVLLSTVLALRHTQEFAQSIDRTVQLSLAEAVWQHPELK